MGGLISLYAYFRHPQVFGLAGAMSPSLWYTRGAIYTYIRHAPVTPGRLYLDNGTREPSASRLERLLVEKGYQPGRDLLYVVGRGRAAHRDRLGRGACRMPCVSFWVNR